MKKHLFIMMGIIFFSLFLQLKNASAIILIKDYFVEDSSGNPMDVGFSVTITRCGELACFNKEVIVDCRHEKARLLPKLEGLLNGGDQQADHAASLEEASTIDEETIDALRGIISRPSFDACGSERSIRCVNGCTDPAAGVADLEIRGESCLSSEGSIKITIDIFNIGPNPAKSTFAKIYFNGSQSPLFTKNIGDMPQGNITFHVTLLNQRATGFHATVESASKDPNLANNAVSFSVGACE